MSSRAGAVVGLVLAIVLFFAVNMVSSAMLRSARLDLTEGRLYTLSEGSKRIVRGLSEPIHLTLYFSRGPASGAPEFVSYANRVRELLEEYVAASGGTVTLDRVDPEPFTDAEDDASSAGLAAVPLQAGGAKIYFGLVGTNSIGSQEVIPFFDPGKETFLEYDVSRLIYALSRADKPVIGLMSWLPLEGGFDPTQGPQGRRPAWIISQQIRGLFEVKTIETSASEIPEDVDVLMIVHPKSPSDETRYAIDQFVMRGGAALVFVDPLCEADIPPGAAQNPMSMLSADRSSNLPGLLEAWGVELEPGKVVGDLSHAMQVVAGQNQQPVEYAAWLSLGQDALDSDDVVTSNLGLPLSLLTPGAITPRDGATTTIVPLVRTGEQSMLIEQSKVSFMPDPSQILRDFQSSGKRVDLAVRITGQASSAFPDGPPGEDADTSGDEQDEESAQSQDQDAPAKPSGHLSESAGPINVIVVGDCDLLQDRAWIRQERLGPISLGYSKLSGNGDFVLGALDNLTGSNDLIGIRARARSVRPFKKVQEIQRQADRQFLAQEQSLQDTLRQTQQKMTELQRARGDEGTSLILTPEQQAEVDRFQQQMVETRRSLRRVQLNRRRDIERLGAKIKFINIGLLPIVVSLAAIGLGGYRSARRRADRRRGMER